LVTRPLFFGWSKKKKEKLKGPKEKRMKSHQNEVASGSKKRKRKRLWAGHRKGNCGDSKRHLSSQGREKRERKLREILKPYRQSKTIGLTFREGSANPK